MSKVLAKGLHLCKKKGFFICEYTVMKEKEFLEKIGENITFLRTKRGYTVQALADLIGMDKSNLIAITKGRYNVTASTLLKFANALKVDPKELVK